VLAKFTLSIGATFLLLLHQFTAVAGAARRVAVTAPGRVTEVGRLGTQLVGDAGLAVLVLVIITTLSVFKPWGRTRYGLRKHELEQRESARLMSLSPIVTAKHPESSQTVGQTSMPTQPTLPGIGNQTPGVLPLGLKIFFLVVIGVILAGFVVLHLTGHGLHGH
jgi:hypothetical protein